MANAVRGETEITVDGKVYILLLNTNALCELESLLKMGINAIGNSLSEDGVSMNIIRAIMWAGLKQRHPELTLGDVGNIIDKLGSEHALAAATTGLLNSFGRTETTDNGEAEEKKTTPSP